MNEVWFENWWPAWVQENVNATGREIAHAAYKAAVAYTQNYVADDEVYPKRVAFANGRVVAYKLSEGRAFLGVGMGSLVEEHASAEVRCPTADDCRQAFNAWFDCSATPLFPARLDCWGTWKAAISWFAEQPIALVRDDTTRRAGFDTWFRSNSDDRRPARWSVGLSIWLAALNWTEDENESDKAQA